MLFGEQRFRRLGRLAGYRLLCLHNARMAIFGWIVSKGRTRFSALYSPNYARWVYFLGRKSDFQADMGDIPAVQIRLRPDGASSPPRCDLERCDHERGT